MTGSALIENAGLTPDSRQCYAGGESRITAADLLDDPKRDRWCATLGEAMGRSLNTVFARLALKNLTPVDLAGMAGAYGFGDTVPFDVPVATNALHIPEDKLGFARTAAGFWNTTMSPLEAATIANTVANHGETLRPVIVESVADASGTLYQAPKRIVLRRAIHPETAAASDIDDGKHRQRRHELQGISRRSGSSLSAEHRRSPEKPARSRAPRPSSFTLGSSDLPRVGLPKSRWRSWS